MVTGGKLPGRGEFTHSERLLAALRHRPFSATPKRGGWPSCFQELLMPHVLLGNPSALDAGRPIPGHQITQVALPGSYTRKEQLRTLFHRDDSTAGVWPMHSAAPAPSWVECPEDPELAAAISEQTGCPIGRPATFSLGTPVR